MSSPSPVPPTNLSRFVPLIVLAAIVVLVLAVWWVFPRVQAWMSLQQCIASGRTNCIIDH